ncbi:type II toxin-antitoxin system RatA family toxin [Streptomyces sp. NPDC058751]|uniref:type II toxin-antitoxin system RatA family toxin n=1 Tax=Streptomyces sp. NPDC058751 TaxID=3346623 RepID=UPI0036BA5317
MRSAHVTLGVPGVTPRAAFARVKDFAAYPDLVDVVRSVTVRRIDDAHESSDWEVYFRNGVLRWTETDRFDTADLTIEFAQSEGDFAEFSGTWAITADGDGCRIAFDTAFDFGIPSLAGILDPVAERVFKETIARVVRGLFPNAEVIGDEAVAKALAAVLEAAAPAGGTR